MKIENIEISGNLRKKSNENVAVSHFLYFFFLEDIEIVLRVSFRSPFSSKMLHFFRSKCDSRRSML